MTEPMTTDEFVLILARLDPDNIGDPDAFLRSIVEQAIEVAFTNEVAS